MLFSFGQFCKCLSGGIGKSAAEAQDRLKSLGGIDKYTYLSFQWLAQMLEDHGVGSSQAMITIVCGGVDCHLSPFDSSVDCTRLVPNRFWGFRPLNRFGSRNSGFR